MVLLTASALVPVWLPDPLPMQDLPNHILKVDLLRRHLGGDAATRAVFELNPRPVPNDTCYFALLALSPFMGLVTAARVFLSGAVLALSLTAWRWARRLDGDAAAALAAVGMAYTSFMSKGFFNFVAGLPMYLAALLLLTRRPFTRRDALLLGGLATLLYLTHGFVFIALVAVSAGWLVLARPPLAETARRAAALVPGVVMLLVWMRGGIAKPTGQAPLDVATPLGVRAWDAVAWLLGLAYGSPIGLVWLLAVLLLVAAGCVALLRRRDLLGSVRENPFLVLAVGMGIAYLVGPDFSGSHARVRWLPIAVLTALPGLHLPRRGLARAAVAAVLVASGVGLHVLNAAAFLDASRSVREYVSGVDAVEPGASILPIDREDPLVGARPNLHSWAYYHLARGGWGPYIHAWVTEHPIAYRAIPWAPDQDIGRAALDQSTVERIAACYDYVLLWDGRGDGTAELGARFELVHESGRLHLWRNRAGVRRRPLLEVPACLASAPAGGA
jgi:hypothetical protein